MTKPEASAPTPTLTPAQRTWLGGHPYLAQQLRVARARRRLDDPSSDAEPETLLLAFDRPEGTDLDGDANHTLHRLQEGELVPTRRVHRLDEMARFEPRVLRSDDPLLEAELDAVPDAEAWNARAELAAQLLLPGKRVGRATLAPEVLAIVAHPMLGQLSELDVKHQHFVVRLDRGDLMVSLEPRRSPLDWFGQPQHPLSVPRYDLARLNVTDTGHVLTFTIDGVPGMTVNVKRYKSNRSVAGTQYLGPYELVVEPGPLGFYRATVTRRGETRVELGETAREATKRALAYWLH